MLLKVVKSGVVRNSLTIILVLLANAAKIDAEEPNIKDYDKYMENFHNQLHKLILKANVTEYVIIGKMKGGCKDCNSIFWSGGSTKSSIPTKNQDDLIDIILKQLEIGMEYPSLAEGFSDNRHSEAESKHKNNQNNEITGLASQSQSYESLSDSEDDIDEEAGESVKQIPFSPEKDVQAQKGVPPAESLFHIQEPNNPALCLNGTEAQMQTSETVVKFEYILLASAFLYVTVVSIVYVTVFCRRPNGYQSGIGSISVDRQDMV